MPSRPEAAAPLFFQFATWLFFPAYVFRTRGKESPRPHSDRAHANPTLRPWASTGSGCRAHSHRLQILDRRIDAPARRRDPHDLFDDRLALVIFEFDLELGLGLDLRHFGIAAD